jgi:peptide/nickel transport system ATP-binding protein/oligopeptide transport system ATP-binding protein
MPEPILDARGVKTYFPVIGGLLKRKKGFVHAVDDVDLAVYPHETIGLVGESGCGKSTLARTLLRLVEPTAGEITFDGQDLTKLSKPAMRKKRQELQIIFQDPVGSLDPRIKVGDLVAEGLDIRGGITGTERRELVASVLERVGLGRDAVDRYPHEFSGGQRQRIGIARALVLNPRLVVADEPVSALDVSVQSQVLNLLTELRREFGLTYIFVAHNLAVVSYISDRIAVMYLGKIVEMARSEDIFRNPLHPYAVALISAIPQPSPGQGKKRIILQGDVPSPISPPSGCRFRTRCPIAKAICTEIEPPLAEQDNGHAVACHFPGEMRP